MAKGIERTKENGKDFDLEPFPSIPFGSAIPWQVAPQQSCLRFTERHKLAERSGKGNQKNQ